MRECLSVHIGQAGVQAGNACWELYCLGKLFHFFVYFLNHYINYFILLSTGVMFDD
jgi:hypothetical protein